MYQNLTFNTHVPTIFQQMVLGKATCRNLTLCLLNPSLNDREIAWDLSRFLHHPNFICNVEWEHTRAEVCYTQSVEFATQVCGVQGTASWENIWELETFGNLKHLGAENIGKHLQNNFAVHNPCSKTLVEFKFAY